MVAFQNDSPFVVRLDVSYATGAYGVAKIAAGQAWERSFADAGALSFQWWTEPETMVLTPGVDQTVEVRVKGVASSGQIPSSGDGGLTLINYTNNAMRWSVVTASSMEQYHVDAFSSYSFDPSNLPPDTTTLQLTPYDLYGSFGDMPSWYYTNIGDEQRVVFSVDMR